MMETSATPIRDISTILDDNSVIKSIKDYRQWKKERTSTTTEKPSISVVVVVNSVKEKF